ncbi:glutamate--tRNA ligase [Aureimonas mangrovi]|uniref:glutamate--tRNA ligase n=1 Tax=Aureimonas mangrovi TaxID=2758041 RepID=UPI00163DE08E|nr:glutamate--tRNA ligase [Aureimonas mangrovi]
MNVLTRFAPSPTGHLHIGNLRPALINWLFAHSAGGDMVLRYDDTDRARSREEYAQAIAEDLAWIGILPRTSVRQQDRLALYDAAVERLREAGLLYPCYETPDELERRRRRNLAAGRPPIYGREALKLTAEDRAALEAEGRRAHWRFLLPNFGETPFEMRRTEARWDDLIRGEQVIDLASLSDPVLVREDGTYVYTITSVVDDGKMGITHVIRGEDHVANTAVQIAIFEALGFSLPAFGHHNLLTTTDGEGLSKRSGALSLRTLREEGYEPMAVASLAVLTGMAGAIEALSDLEKLAKRLDLSAISASSAKFDPAELDRLNADLVHALPHEAVSERLRSAGVPDKVAEPFWLAVRGNCVKVGDAALWWVAVEKGPQSVPAFDEEARKVLHAAKALLPPEPWDERTWKSWTGAVKDASGAKGRSLFMPLRLALTGLDHGPELAALLPLIGRDRTLARL